MRSGNEDIRINGELKQVAYEKIKHNSSRDESVCGRMVACRAAEHLGLNINQFLLHSAKNCH